MSTQVTLVSTDGMLSGDSAVFTGIEAGEAADLQLQQSLSLQVREAPTNGTDKPPPAGRCLTTTQMAKACEVAPAMISKWFDSGRLKGHRVRQKSRSVRQIPLESALQFARENNLEYAIPALCPKEVSDTEGSQTSDPAIAVLSASPANNDPAVAHRTLRISRVAKLFKVEPETVTKWLIAGKLPSHPIPPGKIGGNAHRRVLASGLLPFAIASRRPRAVIAAIRTELYGPDAQVNLPIERRFTVGEVAKLSGCSWTRVSGWLDHHELPFDRLPAGGCRYMTEGNLRAFAARVKRYECIIDALDALYLLRKERRNRDNYKRKGRKGNSRTFSFLSWM